MRYTSTRGSAPSLGFSDVLLSGPADDGGLYVPETWPRLSGDDLASLTGCGYAETALRLIEPFVGDAVHPDELAAMIHEAYSPEVFDHPDICPLTPLGPSSWLLELFHGPTLAFKDVALQLVARLFDHELERRGERRTLLAATSGDTGAAAIEACRGRRSLDIVVLHPAGRVSDVQRRQMTTVDDANVHNIAVEGTFDDCQDLVKAAFADRDLRDRLGLSAVNSINWARIMGQVVYYVTSAVALGAPRRPVTFAVPTGNFGNVFAGWVARTMGVPIRRLIIGSNCNDILVRWLRTGAMEIEEVQPTTSPAMDIQVSSNWERLLHELTGRDGAAVAEAMARFREEGTIDLGPDVKGAAAEVFDGAAFDDHAVARAIDVTYRGTGVLVDPHTAVGLAAAAACHRDPSTPVVTLATAHPAKFPEAVEAATGVRPPLPPHLADLLDRPERCTTIANDLDTLRDVLLAVEAGGRTLGSGP